MNLHSTQKKIAADTHRFRVVNAGRRFGKTVVAVEELLGKALSKNDAKCAYISPTFQQSRDICWDALKKRAEPITKRINSTRLEIEVYTKDGGTSTIWLRGWESIESLRGQRFDFVVVDEIAMMRNWWINWNEVIRPTLSDTKGEGLFLSTPKGFNHFYDLFNRYLEDDDFNSFHFTTYDNPRIDPDEIEKAKQEMTDDQFAQEYMADFRKQEGLVYKEFRRDRHVIDYEPESIAEKIAGIDFGYTNPACVLEIWRDRDYNYYVMGEWYKRGQTEEQIAEYTAAKRFNAVYPDPESPSAIQQLRNYAVNVRDVTKDKDSVENGINKVRELFKQYKLYIHKDCINTIEELESYSYEDPRDNPDKNAKEQPIKLNDHAMDALRYVIYMNYAKQKDLTPRQRMERMRMRKRNTINQSR